MARRGVKVPALARACNKSVSATSKNLNGKGFFTISDASRIRDDLFPDLTIDYLFLDESEEEHNHD